MLNVSFVITRGWETVRWYLQTAARKGCNPRFPHPAEEPYIQVATETPTWTYVVSKIEMPIFHVMNILEKSGYNKQQVN